MQEQDHLKNGWSGLNDVKCGAKSKTKSGFLKFLHLEERSKHTNG